MALANEIRPPRNIGTSKQLLLDASLIADHRELTFTQHRPHPTGEALIAPDAPWENVPGAGIGMYNTILRDGNKIRAWYFWVQREDGGEQKLRRRICYAESDDGIHFTKPQLSLFEMNGHSSNNAVLAEHVQGATVWIDPHAPAEHRYRTQAKYGPLPDYAGPNLFFFSSPDGLHWKETHRLAIGDCDTQTVVFWDERTGRYVMYTRDWVRSDDRHLSFRRVRRLESNDLVEWDSEAIVWEADPVELGMRTTSTGMPPVDYYGALVHPYPEADNLYIMLAQAFWHWRTRPEEERWGFSPDPKNLDKRIERLAPASMDIRLAYSLDGTTFNYGPSRAPFLTPGPDGRFDSRATWALPSPLCMGNEIWFYYMGGNRDHDGFVDPVAGRPLSAIGRAILRMDGFVSADAGAAPGELVTVPLLFEGNRLLLNIETGGGGGVRTEIQDENGNPIEGFSADDADPLWGNHTAAPVTWQGSTDVSPLGGRTVQLRFGVQDCRMYAFRFEAKTE